MKMLPIIAAVLIMLGSAWTITGARSLMASNECESMANYHRMHHGPSGQDKVMHDGQLAKTNHECDDHCSNADAGVADCNGLTSMLQGGRGSDHLSELGEITLLATDILIETVHLLFKSSPHS